MEAGFDDAVDVEAIQQAGHAIREAATSAPCPKRASEPTPVPAAAPKDFSSGGLLAKDAVPINRGEATGDMVQNIYARSRPTVTGQTEFIHQLGQPLFPFAVHANWSLATQTKYPTARSGVFIEPIDRWIPGPDLYARHYCCWGGAQAIEELPPNTYATYKDAGGLINLNKIGNILRAHYPAVDLPFSSALGAKLAALELVRYDMSSFFTLGFMVHTTLADHEHANRVPDPHLHDPFVQYLQFAQPALPQWEIAIAAGCIMLPSPAISDQEWIALHWICNGPARIITHGQAHCHVLKTFGLFYNGVRVYGVDARAAPNVVPPPTAQQVVSVLFHVARLIGCEGDLTAGFNRAATLINGRTFRYDAYVHEVIDEEINEIANDNPDGPVAPENYRREAVMLRNIEDQFDNQRELLRVDRRRDLAAVIPPRVPLPGRREVRASIRQMAARAGDSEGSSSDGDEEVNGADEAAVDEVQGNAAVQQPPVPGINVAPVVAAPGPAVRPDPVPVGRQRRPAGRLIHYRNRYHNAVCEAVDPMLLADQRLLRAHGSFSRRQWYRRAYSNAFYEQREGRPGDEQAQEERWRLGYRFIPASLEIAAIQLPRPVYNSWFPDIMMAFSPRNYYRNLIHDFGVLQSNANYDVLNRLGIVFALNFSLGVSSALNSANVSGRLISQHFDTFDPPPRAATVMARLFHTKEELQNCAAAVIALAMPQSLSDFCVPVNALYLAQWNGEHRAGQNARHGDYDYLFGLDIPYIWQPVIMMDFYHKWNADWGIFHQGSTYNIFQCVVQEDESGRTGWISLAGCDDYRSRLTQNVSWPYVSYTMLSLAAFFQTYNVGPRVSFLAKTSGPSVAEWIALGPEYNTVRWMTDVRLPQAGTARTYLYNSTSVIAPWIPQNAIPRTPWADMTKQGPATVEAIGFRPARPTSQPNPTDDTSGVEEWFLQTMVKKPRVSATAVAGNASGGSSTGQAN